MPCGLATKTRSNAVVLTSAAAEPSGPDGSRNLCQWHKLCELRVGSGDGAQLVNAGVHQVSVEGRRRQRR